MSTNLILSSTTEQQQDKVVIEAGLDFILSHFNQDRLLPRTIQTRKTNGRQIEVFSKEEALSCFKESNFIDCKINAFPSFTEYKGVQRYPPDFIFIDIDRKDFKTDKGFDNALSTTLKIIKKKLNGVPSVNVSGNGYHIILPIECSILENVPEFEKYDKPSEQFLRFAEYDLSNGKADIGHRPSFKSCQIRVPGSINGKYLENRDKRLSGNFRVKILEKWNGYRPRITIELLLDFRKYLIQKKIDGYNRRQKIIMLLNSRRSNNNNINNNYNYYQ